MAELNPTSMVLREFEPADIHALHDLDRRCFPPDIAFSHKVLLSYIRNRRSVTRIAELSGEIIGFAVGRLTGLSSAHVLTLDVDQKVRRRNIGTALMNALHEEFHRRGARVCLLEVDVGNSEARRFYERLRYEYVGLLPGYYNGRSDALRMMLRLKAGVGN